MSRAELLTCGLCGREDRDVEPGIAWFREPVSREIEVIVFRAHVQTTERQIVQAHVEAISRCRDAQACRGRVEAAGGQWKLEDSTMPTPRPAVVPEPSSIPAETGMTSDDVDAWLA